MAKSEDEAPLIEVLEIQGPPNDPELALPEAEKSRRRKARFAFSQLCWHFQELRIAASIGYQAAKGGWSEAMGTSSESSEARYELLRMKESADKWKRLNLELMSQRWEGYHQMHAAQAENGAAAAVTTIDKTFRQFGMQASMPESELIGGPEIGSQSTTFLELARAGGNWSRHRHEWHAKRYRWDDDHENWSVRTLSRCGVYHLDDNVFAQIVDKMPWRTWVEAEEALVRVAYGLISSAFESPYCLSGDDLGYWNSKDRHV